MTGAEDYLREVIRLQLKKPKNWNWELSTSTSSPHIALPTIELYNTKGQLLVQANDNGTTRRQSWNNLHVTAKSKEKERSRSINSTYLQRCKSDNLERRLGKDRSFISPSVPPTIEIATKDTKLLPNTIKRCRSDTLGNVIAQKTCYSVNPSNERERRGLLCNKLQDKETNGRSFGGSSNYVNSSKGKLGQFSQWREKVEDDTQWKNQCRNTGGLFHLQKSRSEVLDMKGRSKPLHNTFSEGQSQRLYHRRTGSDDLFQKMRRKYNIKESLRRAETDGYKKFIYSDQEPEKKSVEDEEENAAKDKKKKRFAGCLATAESIICKDEAKKIEINNVVKPRRYRLRQSRAGILVISDESFSYSHRRRCHGEFGDCRSDSGDIIIDGDKLSSLEELPVSYRHKPQRSRSEKDKLDVSRSLDDASSNRSRSRHFRQSSDPAGVKTAKFTPNRYRIPQHTNDVCNNVERNKSTRDGSCIRTASSESKKGLLQSSEIFPFQNTLNMESSPYKGSKRQFTLDLDSNSNYIVQEPLTTPGSESGKDVCDSVVISESSSSEKRRNNSGRNEHVPWRTYEQKAKGKLCSCI